jgi:uncharacterized protein (TIGR03435 family)
VSKHLSVRLALATFFVVEVVGVLSTAAQQLPLPTFRSGVRLVEVDVTVRDKDDRFIDTLTKDDFEVLEDGAPRQIQQLWTVNLPVDSTAVIPTAATSAVALVGSDTDVGRLYVLVLSDGSAAAVRRVARQFITDFLAPTDLMSVVHVGNRAATQGLTADRELLLASVDRYRGVNTDNDYEASLGVLKDVAVSLNASTGRRKSVLFIGEGFKLWTPLTRPGEPLNWFKIQEGIDARKRSRVFDDMEKAARRNNVRIYPIDPAGFGSDRSAGSGDLQASGGGQGDTAASLRILAADTGGKAIVNTDNYSGNFPRIVRDNSAYYLLTYDSAADADGHPHPITVRVRNRPGLTVSQGRQSFVAPTPDVKGRAVAMPRSLSSEARRLLATTTPAQGDGIELFTAVFQASNYNGSVLIGTHVQGSRLRLTPNETIELSYVAIDRWGVVRAAERRAFTMNLSEQSRVSAERAGVRLLGRVQVPRGQYQIRVVAHQVDGITASAATDVEVPDYTDQPLSVSEFVVASSHGPRLATLEEDAVLRAALLDQPTPARRFARDETLALFAEIYDGHWIVSQEVGATMTVATENGRVVFRREQVLTSGNKGRFYLKGTLPLGGFGPGDYQLLVEVHTRKGIPANASRQMRFTVLDAPAPTVPAPVLRAAPEATTFELVSVRRAATPKPASVRTPVPPGEFRILPDGRLEARGQTLANLARIAFGFDAIDPRGDLVQAANWMWNDRFDVTASKGQPWSTPPSATSVPAELRTMLRTMLEDRFTLHARTITKKVDVTALRLANAGTLGSALRPTTVADVCREPNDDASSDDTLALPLCPPRPVANRMINAKAITMSEVALLFSQYPGWYSYAGPFVDETGLLGRYDLSFVVPPGGQSATIQADFERQLGVKLTKTRVQRPALIIESAKKPQED